MLSRTLVRAVVPLSKRALALNTPCVSVMATRLDHHGPPANYKFPTMDEMPVPCGSWKEHYDNNQRKYNIHLLLGFGVFIITLFCGISSGALDLYLLAPEKPGPRPSER